MEMLNQCMEYKNSIVELSIKACNLIETFKTMIKGTSMYKYAFKHGKKQGKEFSITSDFQYFQWKPMNSNRGIRKFLVSDITQITPGNSEFSCKNHQDIKLDSDSLCFTVHLKERPVNIVALNEKDKDLWVSGLKNLIKEDKTSLNDGILNYDYLFNELFPKIIEEFNGINEKDLFKSSESVVIEDYEVSKLKKKVKELEKNNIKLQKEIFEAKSKADKDFKTEDDLKKELRQKEKSEKKLQSKIEILSLQLETLEKEHTQKILNFEEKLTQKDSRLLELQGEYDEFKKQIKESFNKTLVQKVQQYRESKEVLGSYVNFLKDRLETIEKEVALWQAVVYTHVLPIYQSKNSGKTPQLKHVLEFALDTMERKLLTNRSQTQFMSLLTEARRNVKN
jgi:DNA repair exonuclease SbcCD ATPase subunit